MTLAVVTLMGIGTPCSFPRVAKSRAQTQELFVGVDLRAVNAAQVIPIALGMGSAMVASAANIDSAEIRRLVQSQT